MKLRAAEFEEILPFWSTGLWPGRASVIRPVSPFNHERKYEQDLRFAEARFWALESPSGEIVGVVSGYQTAPNYFRSRGLWVAEHYRRQGLSRQLLGAVAVEAERLGCAHLWTLPRQSAWPAYQAFGFNQETDWFTEGMEFGPNCMAVYTL